MKSFFFALLFLFSCFLSYAQTPKTLNSAEILLRLKKLNVLGSVLYIAAHPDDENTRLLAFLANEKLYRTGYLSVTRGDGGQNLIGDEQGIELGLIRTQELLAARRIDGAEQFFTRGYDFGFCKSTAEALQKWDKEIVLSDVVWVIRRFRPDVIITRFPEDSRAGHGHHSASAVLAHEAFIAAADPDRFPEQFRKGVKPWQAKRLLWNTFNFGGNNTQSDDQFKIEVGGYNALLGKSYGEIAAESRSQHKSQGFGVAAQRGVAWEYFVPVAGERPRKDLMEGVETTWMRTGNNAAPAPLNIQNKVNDIIGSFSAAHPEKSAPALVNLYKQLQETKGLNDYWQSRKLKEIAELVVACSGLYFEATTRAPYVAAGDSLSINIQIINRGGVAISGKVVTPFEYSIPGSLEVNNPVQFSKSLLVPVDAAISQPYWLEKGLDGAHFVVDNQELIGLPESPAAYSVKFSLNILGQQFDFSTPVRYKHTDPVQGEVYQPMPVVPALSLTESPTFIFTRLNQKPAAAIKLSVTGLSSTVQKASVDYYQYVKQKNEWIKSPVLAGQPLSLRKNEVVSYLLNPATLLERTKETELGFYADLRSGDRATAQQYTMRKIEYGHIPAITYFYPGKVKIINEEIKTVGKKVGYIVGAGDKVPEALQELGYEVSFLGYPEISGGNLKGFDAIVVGVRAYNVNKWLENVYDVLMNYIKEGGNLVIQYNTSNFIGTLNSKIGPYPFEVSRGRVTDENAKVDLLDADNLILKWPNVIEEKDFDNWIQERGLYFVGKADKSYKHVFAMKDPGEGLQDGSLIVCNYGKGRFIYTGLSFFRQLPAGIGGAYRLFANLVANPNFLKTDGTAKKE